MNRKADYVTHGSSDRVLPPGRTRSELGNSWRGALCWMALRCCCPYTSSSGPLAATAGGRGCSGVRGVAGRRDTVPKGRAV
jgi:hypothetical protein